MTNSINKKSIDFPKKVLILDKKDKRTKKVTGCFPKNVNVLDNGSDYTDIIKGSERAE